MTVSSKAGRYELETELGRGAMGVVYRAYDPVIGRPVAVKTVRLTEQATGMSHAELLTRFQTEARAAGLLTHPNIVVVYDAGEDDGLFYITMELVEGQSLQAHLDERQTFPLPRVLRLMQQACSALEFAHQHKVVHRDIKPANLMLTPEDTLKITDFGTAKILQVGATQTSRVIGTPSCMSPEQIKGQPVDGRSDIFSLGVVLYELLTGEKPFSGDSVTTVIYKIVNDDPVPPREIDSSIHPGLSAVVMRALAKSADARFQTCREFSDALQNYRSLGGTLAAPARSTAALPLEAAKSAAALRSGPPSGPRLGPQSGPRPALRTTLAPSQASGPSGTRAKQRGSLLLAAVLIVVIAGAGYRVWPALGDIWQRSHTVSSETALEAKPSSLVATPQQQPSPGTAPETTKPPAPVAMVAAVAKAPAKASPTALVEAPRQPSKLVPSPDATEWKGRVEQAFAETGTGGRVQANVAGSSLTLTGQLGPRAHRRLLNFLASAPADVHIIDDIEYADEPAATPAAGGTGLASVRSNPPGAEIFVDGVDTGQKTPARIQLPNGNHVVFFSLTGFRTGRNEVEVQPNKVSEITHFFSHQ